MNSANRESGRLKDVKKKIVLDETTRQRRLRKALDALEEDNFHTDPHADLVMNKKIPKFSDDLETRTPRKKKGKGADYYKQRYRKTFAQLVEEDRINNPEAPNYLSAQADPPTVPPRRFCAVCGAFQVYKCVSCGAGYCSTRCLKVHVDTRCLKWTV